MGMMKFFLLLALVAFYALATAVGGYEDAGGSGRREVGQGAGDGEGEGGTIGGEDGFLLRESKDVVKTDAGNMRVVSGVGRTFWRSPMQIGFISMEPNSLFIPQYLDSSLILFIRRGEARLGHIYKDNLVERRLKTGDVYTIGAGSAFYLVNTAEGQKLYIICSIDTSESLRWHGFQSFFIAGGSYPTSVLAGFDRLTLSTAFNVSVEELEEIMTKQRGGPIVYLSDSKFHPPSIWSKFMDLEQHQRLAYLKRIMPLDQQVSQDEEEPSWSIRKLLGSIFGNQNRIKRDDRNGKGPEAYNLYDKKPDFKNDYGWSKALDESDYPPLSHYNIGVYLVNLTAGSMMAPHINPTATEYGIVLSGTGRIEIVYPNGTLAMNAKVREGDIFLMPRFFPFCQIASRTGPFEFLGYTTSARENRPQFLVGKYSLLQTMRGPEIAAAFGITEQRLGEIIDAQNETLILPSPTVAPPVETATQLMDKGGKANPKVMIKSFGNDKIKGF